MARSLALALLVLAAAATVQARIYTGDELSSPKRSLLLESANAYCPDGCTDTGCVADATTAGLRCQKCQGNLIVDRASGRCACPAGKWSSGLSSTPICLDCPKGSYCSGRIFNLSALPFAVECPAQMTTLGLRSTSNRACVNAPGTYYTISADGSTIGAVTCPINTYSAGYKKQRACVPCPTGYTTNGLTGAMRPDQCVVPAGYYLKAPGQVAPCPKGEWKSGVNSNASCTKCAFGVTTATEASTKETDCSILLPGYYAVGLRGAIVTSVKPCPQKYYCAGGVPLSAFDPANPGLLNVNETSIKACPNGQWTIDYGATALEQCMTPPGYYTSGGVTAMCPAGSYRADWKAAGATTCIPCGDGIKASKTDQVAEYNIATYELVNVPITTSADDCYIMPGQGLYYNTLTATWRARNCDTNNYGVANATYGLTPYSCRDCPTNMVTSSNNVTYPRSAAYYVDNGDGTKGFINVMACVTRPAYGWDARISQACDKGWWNPQDSYTKCTECTFGLTTSGPGIGTKEADCGLAPGYGLNAVNATYSAIMPCPIGTYSDTIRSNRSTACIACPTGLTTSGEGSDSYSDCRVCQAGYGGTNCATQCGGGTGDLATYGPIGRSNDTDSACLVCSSQSTGFSFEWQLANDLYQSPTIARLGANASLDCLAEFAQVVDGSWYLPVTTNDEGTTAVAGVNTFGECVALCDSSCQFVTYDYDNKTCNVRKTTDPDLIGMPLLAIKNFASGDVGTNAFKVQKAKAKAAAAGTYTFYQDTYALNVGGSEPRVIPAARTGWTELRQCLEACDEDEKCAAVAMKMNVNIVDRPKTCELVRGVSKLGVFKRTVTRADIARLPLIDLWKEN